MTQICKETCDQHSGMCSNYEHLETRLSDFKQELAEYKGFVNAKLDGTSTELKELRKDMIAEINRKFDELKTLIEGKEKEKNNKMWSIVSPLIVGVVLLFGQYLLKLLN